MHANELASMWLRDRAEELRKAAKRAEGAYTKDPLRSACERVAKAYRSAAVVLDDAATEEEVRDV